MDFRACHLSRLLASVALLAVGPLAGGCTKTAGGNTPANGILGARMSMAADPAPRDEAGWRKVATAAGERYRANPRDAEAAMRYAEALRRTGQSAQAAAVLQQISLVNPRDKQVLGAYGRALAETGNLEEALDVLGRAHTPDQPDWRILSVQGAVLDQMGRHADARSRYASALKIVPDEPSVLSNLGMSYVLSRELPQAEETLRRAASRGAGDRRVRQNLALAVGLQGRFAEAEDIARADLPPEEAAANVGYLRQMLAQHKDGPGAARPRSGRAG